MMMWSMSPTCGAVVETANALFGNAASVLVGDFLYSRTFQMMVEVGSMRVMRVLSEATNIIAEGEVLQLMNCHDADVDEARYLQVIRYKTAKLFEAAAQVGAIVGGASEEVERSLAAYGMHLGTAFQLIDDVLDYSGAEVETGKHLGDDLAEGKPTLPLILRHAARQCRAGGVCSPCHRERRSGRLFLGPGGDSCDRVRWNHARKNAKAEAEAALAAHSIECLPASTYKDSLLELCLFAVARSPY
jgi:octaprenyl-diphosphate synthase